MPRLKGTIAVVTGASRGAGLGIAVVLGEDGATVYVTGRSSRGGRATEGLPGTVEEAAEAVTARGGVGVPVRCDHTVDAEVEALFERVRQERGRLDILVNNVWGGYEGHEHERFAAPFWEQPVRHWDGMFTAGLRAHLTASRLAIPLMLPQRSGLIVSTTAWDRDRYLGNLYYDVAKTAVNRMTYGLACELRPHGIVAVALAPGFMRTERVLAAHRQAPFDLSGTESPEYLGRAVAALAADPDTMRKSGSVQAVGNLAAEYGFTDIDGRWVPPFAIPDEFYRRYD
jgi:NAD(P)-dependent dehydrogenase (short-subunit alcohol dehydrogenase family)